MFDHREGQHVEVAGARIWVQCIGPEEGPPLVLLHGGLGTMADFNSLLPALAGWRLIGIDSRGHGKSTLGNAPWTYQRVQEDAEQVLQEIGVSRGSMLGFSDGGIAALRMGVSGKVLLDRLVVVGTTWHAKNLASSRRFLEEVTAESWKAKFPETVETYERLNPEPDFARLVFAVVPGWLDEGPSGHPGDAVARIESQVLVVRGDDDHLAAATDAVELRDVLPRGYYLSIPFGGHVAYEDAPEVFLPALKRFLGSPRNSKLN